MPPYAPVETRVLVVDDDPRLREVIRIFLESTGHVIVTLGASAIDAMYALETEYFDVCVSDYDMPGMNGVQFIREIRKDGYDLPCILMTGDRRREVHAAALGAGAWCVVLKGGKGPVFFSELVEAIMDAAERGAAGGYHGGRCGDRGHETSAIVRGGVDVS